ncbi:hypothetical protein L195_g060383, partial [Trifolium pratense]
MSSTGVVRHCSPDLRLANRTGSPRLATIRSANNTGHQLFINRFKCIRALVT